jgi:mRNA interferase RelE/StbE
MYTVRLLKPASRGLGRLDKSVATRIVRRLRWLAENLDSINPEPLKGDLQGLYKLREGDYGIAYEYSEVTLDHGSPRRSPARNLQVKEVAEVRRKTGLVLDSASNQRCLMRKLATDEGIIENGGIELPPDAEILNRTRVDVVVADSEAALVPCVASPHLADREKAKDFEKSIIEVV